VREEGDQHAVNANTDYFDRGGRPAVAGKSLHSNAGLDQVNFEWCCDYRCGSVASECLWALSRLFSDARRNLAVTQGKRARRNSGGFGNTRPTGSNDDSACRQQNHKMDMFLCPADVVGNLVNATEGSLRSSKQT
jgi:hypothetical protein